MHHTHDTDRARDLPRSAKQVRKGRLARWGRIAAATLVAAAGVGAAAGPALADAQTPSPRYDFTTLDNANDPTFNQLLGINDHGVIAGYFGSGAAGHPNKGYLLFPDYGQGSYLNENFPGSVQTQVTGLNNRGVTVGFWSRMNNASQMNDNHGFVEYRGHFRTADYPTVSPATPPVDQLLGVNDRDIAVGFYTDAKGTNHGYEYNIRRHIYSSVVDPLAPGASLTGAAINDRGDVAGFYTNPTNGNTDGFLLSDHGRFVNLTVPGATSTSALGVNNLDEVVGVYTDAAGVLHGFTWTLWGGFQTVDDLHASMTAGNGTTINGVNDEGQLVGFYTDTNGNTDGLLATPQHHHHDR